MAAIVGAAVAFVLISLLLLVAIIQNSVDNDRLIATPSIPLKNAVLTAFASTKVKGSADEVFSVVQNYKGYSDWSPFHEYKWKDVSLDGVPRVGSMGTFKLTMEDFPERLIPVTLTVLDRENRKIAEKSTSYPKWLLSSERVQEVVSIEGQPGFCEYRTYQTVEGIGAYYLLLTVQEDLNDCQNKCATELKAFVEQEKR
ncbi:uncharacterized protein LY89DRAFT_575707 [Mollisia scopiformis]|uniref:Uncharacterized protein n=1 Tax=Mollisia scopiformis TaxID=149040 RepID=A0A194XQJ8_MOLSC|nr:uncharacterized protein LY89DRAFT_575707 [Mollisia scopiformis]KUJ22334.1 hypothetical protein LY89DRAFT_575707 [Mollisia scopiformis]